MLHLQCAAAMEHRWNLKPQQLLHAGRPAPPRLSLKVQCAGYALAMLAALWTGSHRFAYSRTPSPPIRCSILQAVCSPRHHLADC